MNSVELHALKVEAGYIGESHGLTPITRRYTAINSDSRAEGKGITKKIRNFAGNINANKTSSQCLTR